MRAGMARCQLQLCSKLQQSNPKNITIRCLALVRIMWPSNWVIYSPVFSYILVFIHSQSLFKRYAITCKSAIFGVIFLQCVCCCCSWFVRRGWMSDGFSSILFFSSVAICCNACREGNMGKRSPFLAFPLPQCLQFSLPCCLSVCLSISVGVFMQILLID